MWTPSVRPPPLVAAGIGGVFSRRCAKTVLPVAAGLYTANGLLGEYFHARGDARKPGGWRLWAYNLPMGPPISAPGLMAMVAGMGLLAAVLRRARRWARRRSTRARGNGAGGGGGGGGGRRGGGRRGAHARLGGAAAGPGLAAPPAPGDHRADGRRRSRLRRAGGGRLLGRRHGEGRFRPAGAARA